MATNLFTGAVATAPTARWVLKDGSDLTDLQFSGSSGLALDGRTGELNANNKQELLVQIGRLMKAVENGAIVNQVSTSNSDKMSVEEKRQTVMAAYADPSGEGWAALGSSIAVKVQQQRARQGFMRRMFLPNNLKTGDAARVAMTDWTVGAVAATSASNVSYQLTREKIFYPAEIELIANVRAEQLAIEQGTGDFLDELYTQALDSLMVQEDRLAKAALDKCVNIDNNLILISGDLTPRTLASLRNGVTDWNLPATTAVISNDFWSDVSGNSDFATFLDPVTKYDLNLNGFVATLNGLNLWTDGFRQRNQKVLNRGEIYVITSPENLGVYSDRGGIRAKTTSGADSGNTTSGWLMSSIISLVLSNTRGVQKAVRI